MILLSQTRMRVVPFLAVLLIASFGVNGIQAANINVTDSAADGDCIPGGDPCTDFDGSTCSLQDALDVAGCNGENDVINVAGGFYDADVANTFSYAAATGENFSLDIIGAGTTTILDGNDSGDLVMDINTGSATTDTDADVRVSAITFQNAFFGGSGAGLRINTGDADITVDHCQFLSNDDDDGQGGGIFAQSQGDGALLFDSNFFQENTALEGGGGVFAETGNGNIRAINNILTLNSCTFNGGGGMAFVSGTGSIEVVNNTLFDNDSTDAQSGFGGGLFANIDDSVSTIDIYNNIVYANTATVDGDDIFTCEQGGTVNLFNNDFIEFVSGGVSAVGFCGSNPVINQDTTNLNIDPLFVNSGAADFHLTSTSPVIDKGTLTPTGGLPNPDFDGNPRPSGPLPDMGALEFQIIPTPTPTPTAIPIPTPTPPVATLIEGSGCQLNASGLGGQTLGTWLSWFSLGGVAWAARRRMKG